MRTRIAYFFIMIIIAGTLAGCGDTSATVDQMEMRSDLAYRKGESRPFTGVVTGAHSNGNPESQFHYKEGRRHGEALNFYINGVERSRVTYVHGVVQGPVVLRYENGNKMLEATSVNGRAHGIVTNYYENGIKSSETSYVDGLPRGIRKQWHKDGRFFQEYKILEGGKGMQFQ